MSGSSQAIFWHIWNRAMMDGLFLSYDKNKTTSSRLDGSRAPKVNVSEQRWRYRRGKTMDIQIIIKINTMSFGSFRSMGDPFVSKIGGQDKFYLKSQPNPQSLKLFPPNHNLTWNYNTLTFQLLRKIYHYFPTIIFSYLAETNNAIFKGACVEYD